MHSACIVQRTFGKRASPPRPLQTGHWDSVYQPLLPFFSQTSSGCRAAVSYTHLIELKPYLDRDEEIVDRIIDAVLDAGLEEKAVLTSFAVSYTHLDVYKRQAWYSPFFTHLRSYTLSKRHSGKGEPPLPGVNQTFTEP